MRSITHTVGRLYCQGYSLGEIASKVNEQWRTRLTVRRVYEIIAKMHMRYEKTYRERDRQELRHIELMKLDTLEREYWEAWFRSLQVQRAEVVVDSEGVADVESIEALREHWRRIGERPGDGKKGGSQPLDVKKVAKKWVEACGDPRYLAGVQWCIDKRCKLLGLDAPTRAVTAAVDMRQMVRELAVRHNLDPELVVEEVLADAERILAEARRQAGEE